MLRFAVDSGDSVPRRLLYPRELPEELVFRPELDSLARTLPDFVPHYTVTRPAESHMEWSGRVGRISVEWIRSAVEGLEDPRFYIAGLPEMVQEGMVKIREATGVPPDQITFEAFRGY